MPLIKCKECKKEISSNAISCPSCGAPVKPLKKKRGFVNSLKKMIIYGVIFWALIYGGILYIKHGAQEKTANVKAEKEQAELQAKAKKEEEDKQREEAMARYAQLSNKEKYATPEIGDQWSTTNNMCIFSRPDQYTAKGEVIGFSDSYYCIGKELNAFEAGGGFHEWRIGYKFNKDKKVAAIIITNMKQYGNPGNFVSSPASDMDEKTIMELYSDQGLIRRESAEEMYCDLGGWECGAASRESLSSQISMSFGCKAYRFDTGSAKGTGAADEIGIQSMYHQPFDPVLLVEIDSFQFINGENKDAKSCTLVYLDTKPQATNVLIIKLNPNLTKLNEQ